MIGSKTLLFGSCLAAALIALPASGAKVNMNDWNVRPHEIISGQLTPRCPTLWQYKAGAEKDFELPEGVSITSGSERPLWSEATAKLVGAPKGKSTFVKFKEPISVARADGVELWVFGPKGARSKVEFRCIDGNGKEFVMHTNSGSSNWASNPWWGAAVARFPYKTVFPVKVAGFAVTIADSAKDNTMYFDMLGAFTLEDLPIPDTSKDKLPFPTSPEGIRPYGGAADGKCSVTEEKERYVFKYAGSDGTLEYIYTPKSGTLSDITCVVDGRYTFQPAKDGGMAVRLKGARFIASDAAHFKTELVKKEFKNNELTTFWRWSRGKRSFEFTLKFSMYKRVLTVTAESNDPAVEKFDTGYAVGSGVQNPRLFTVSYLNNRWDAPQMMVTDNFFVSVFLDWYCTNSSEYTEGKNKLGLKGAAVMGKDSARIMGGSVYLPKTDGQRNTLHECMYITVAPQLADILPVIRNPKSPYYKDMSQVVACTRQYALQGKGDIERELEFWRNMHAYGAGDVFLRFHGGKFRMPMASQRLNRSLEFNKNIGSNEDMRDMVTELKTLVKYVGPYEDNRIMSPLNLEFKYAYVPLWRDGTCFPGYDNGLSCAPSTIDLLQKEFSPKFVAKYGWNACYMDEVTNTPPWGLVNYDYRDPGAAMHRSVLRDYALSSMNMRKYYNGPIWSEGNAMYFWAGTLDLDYGQSNEPKAVPLVDFKLTRINPLQCVTGYDLPMYKADIDFLLARQIAFGHTGYLWDGGSGHFGFSRIIQMNKDDLRNVLKSYFMMRQLQEQYIGVPVKNISYNIDDELVSASDMLKKNLKNSGMVKIEYANGLTVWVNCSTEEYWSVEVDGMALELPPNSHAAFRQDVLLQYSGEKDGARVDYSRGPRYTYVDGRGTSTVFPEIQAANAYVIFAQNGSKKLIPAPFMSAESVGNLSAAQAVALDRSGKALDNKIIMDMIDNGKGRFNTIESAFAYQLK